MLLHTGKSHKPHKTLYNLDYYWNSIVKFVQYDKLVHKKHLHQQKINIHPKKINLYLLTQVTSLPNFTHLLRCNQLMGVLSSHNNYKVLITKYITNLIGHSVVSRDNKVCYKYRFTLCNITKLL